MLKQDETATHNDFVKLPWQAPELIDLDEGLKGVAGPIGALNDGAIEALS